MMTKIVCLLILSAQLCACAVPNKQEAARCYPLTNGEASVCDSYYRNHHPTKGYWCDSFADFFLLIPAVLIDSIAFPFRALGGKCHPGADDGK